MHMKQRLILSICLTVVAFCPSVAQKQTSVKPALSPIAQSYGDSVSSLINKFSRWKYQGADTLSNPYYFQLFAAPTYYSSAVKQQFSLPEKPSDIMGDARMEAISKTLSQTYVNSPWLISSRPQESATIEPTAPISVLTPSEEFVAQTPEVPDAPEVVEDNALEIEIKRPNFWTFPFNFTFQLMQNYISSNWYKGGESNRSFLAALVFQANYDNKQKFIFNNKLEAKFGLQSSHSDSEHRYKTNSDLIRLTNEVGYKLSKHWYYSAMLQSWTQFSRGYKKNDPKIYSDFLSPFESILTLGLKYTYTSPKKKFTLDANISPAACDFVYVSRPSLETAFGLKAGHHTKFEIGSNITATYKWIIYKNIEWAGRIYYYTNYKRTVVEWENTFSLKVNRFLSTQIFLYPRFEDCIARVEGKSFFQFKEYLSVGLDISL